MKEFAEETAAAEVRADEARKAVAKSDPFSTLRTWCTDEVVVVTPHKLRPRPQSFNMSESDDDSEKGTPEKPDRPWWAGQGIRALSAKVQAQVDDAGFDGLATSWVSALSDTHAEEVVAKSLSSRVKNRSAYATKLARTLWHQEEEETPHCQGCPIHCPKEAEALPADEAAAKEAPPTEKEAPQAEEAATQEAPPALTGAPPADEDVAEAAQSEEPDAEDGHPTDTLHAMWGENEDWSSSAWGARAQEGQDEEEGAEAQEGQGTSHAMWSQDEAWSSSAWGAGAQEGHDEGKDNDVQGWTDQEAIEAANALYHPEEDPEGWAQDKESDDWDEEEWAEDKEVWPDTDRSG